MIQEFMSLKYEPASDVLDLDYLHEGQNWLELEPEPPNLDLLAQIQMFLDTGCLHRDQSNKRS